jgi:hypothetical protein
MESRRLAVFSTVLAAAGRHCVRTQTITMASTGAPGIPRILRLIAGWVMLVVLGVLTLNEYGPRIPPGYTPAPIRFAACSPLTAVIGAQTAVALAAGFIVVLSAESLFGRTMSSKARLSAAIVVGTILFGMSFGGALLLRHRFIGVCA